jgi:hypothetical protein
MAVETKPEGPIARLIENAASNDPVALRLAELVRASIRPAPLSPAQLHGVAQQVSISRIHSRFALQPAVAAVGVTAVAVTAVVVSLALVHGHWKARPLRPTPMMNRPQIAPPAPEPVDLAPRRIVVPSPAQPTASEPPSAIAGPEPTRPIHHRQQSGSAPDDALESQVAVIQHAMTLLRVKHDVDAAVRVLSDFEHRFPGGQLVPEARALLEEALLAKSDAGK